MLNKTTTALLALILGTIGGQYFYLGKTGWGIVSVLFCWSFIPTFIGFYHFLKFLLMSEQRFNIRYNNGVYVMNSNINVADELQKLGQLKRDGILTEAEFEERKSKILKNA